MYYSVQRGRPRQERGFTLIELLVVVAIIVVLIGILLPSLGKARSLARRAACLSQLRQWGIGYSMYAQEWDEDLPYTGHGDGNKAGSSIGYWDDPSYWANAVPALLSGNNKTYYQMQQDDQNGIKPLPRSGSSSIFVCPEAEPAQGVPQYDLPAVNGCFQLWGVLPGQSVATTASVYWSYVTNSKIDNSVTGYFPMTDAEHPTAFSHPIVRRTAIPSWSTVPFIVEKLMSPDEYSPAFSTEAIGRGKTTYTRMAGRHSGGGNIAFVDGHAEWFSIKDLWPAPYGNNPGTANNDGIPGRVVWDPFDPND